MMMKDKVIYLLYMSEKNEVLSNPDPQSNKDQKELSEKEHIWKDEELYPEGEDNDQERTCWEKFTICCNNFLNRTIDYFQFDRLFEVEGEKKIDLRKCNKRFLEDYDQTYSQRQMRFGYTFEYVLKEKIKEEEKKEKHLYQEFYRFICCKGGNQMIEIDEAYKSDREYQALIKKKIMERKKDYQEEKLEEEKKKAEQAMKNEESHEVMQLETLQPQVPHEENVLEYREEPDIEQTKIVGQGQPSHVQIKKVKVRKERVQNKIQPVEEEQIYRNKKVVLEQNNNGSINEREKEEKQMSKTQSKTQDNYPSPQVLGQSSPKNKVNVPKKSSSEFDLKQKSRKNLQTEETIVTKNVYHENHIYHNIYHEQNERRSHQQKIQGNDYIPSKQRNEREQNEPQFKKKNRQDYLPPEEMNQKRENIQQLKKNKKQKDYFSPEAPEEQYQRAENDLQSKKKKKIFKKELQQNFFVSQDHPQKMQTSQNQNFVSNEHKNQITLQKSPKITEDFVYDEPKNQMIFQKSPKLKEDLPDDQPKNQLVFQRSPKLTYDEPDNINPDALEEQVYQAVSKPKKKKRMNRVEVEDSENIAQSQAFQREPSKEFQIGDNSTIEAVMYRTETNKWKKNKIQPPEIQEEEEVTGVAAKKKRKARRELSKMQIGDEQIMIEDDANDHYSKTLEVEPMSEIKSSKKKRVRKQIKKDPSDEVFEEVIMDTIEIEEQNQKNEEVVGVSQIKAEKKRKKIKAKKPQIEDAFDEIIDLDL